MASQTLLQAQRDELAASAVETAPVLVVESRIISVSISNTGSETRTPGRKQFEFDADLRELTRKDDSIRVGFRLSFGNSVFGQSCRLAGEAIVRLSCLTSNADLQGLGGAITEAMAVSIFRKNFESIYLLHDALGIEAPSPWITQDVSVSPP